MLDRAKAVPSFGCIGFLSFAYPDNLFASLAPWLPQTSCDPLPFLALQFHSYCRLLDLGDNFSTYILLNYGQIIS
jgi:hypothetical protein